MIENTLWMTYFEYLPIELKQAEEEGKNVELYRKEIEEIIQTSGDMSFEEKERKAWEILDRIEKEPIKREFPYQEPNEIEKIEELRNTELRRNFTVDQATIEDRVWGAWLGRCIGCLLGQPIEGWKRKRIEGFLKDTKADPPYCQKRRLFLRMGWHWNRYFAGMCSRVCAVFPWIQSVILCCRDCFDCTA